MTKSKLKTALAMLVVAGSLVVGVVQAMGLPTEGPCTYKPGCKFGGNAHGCCQAW